MNVLSFLVTLFFASVSGFAAYKMKIPAGAMIGSLLGVITLNLLFDGAYFYQDLRLYLQLLAGAMIGSRVGKKDLAAMKTIIFPTLFLLASMVTLNLVFGSLMYRIGGLDIATSLFASAPGGVADMALISADLGANPAYVGVLQILRILVIIVFLPSLFKWVLLRRAAMKNPQITLERFSERKGKPSVKTLTEGPSGEVGARVKGSESKRFIGLLLFAAAGGLLFRQLGVTAGALTGSMLFGAVFCVSRGVIHFPDKLKFILQILSGVFIGVGIDRASVKTLPGLLIPAAIMVVGIFVFTFAAALIMHRLFKLDLAVCLLSCAPGGVQEMALLSEELGADTAKISVMQTTRLVFVIMLFPTMLAAVTLFVGS